MQGITIADVNFFPHHFFFVERLALFVFMSNGENAEHSHLFGDSQCLPHKIFGRFVHSSEPSPHLYPAASQTEVGGLQLHENGSDRSILDPRIGEGHVGGDDDSERSSGNGFGSRSLAFGQTGERFFVFHRNELPRSAAFGRRSEQSRFENGFYGFGR